MQSPLRHGRAALGTTIAGGTLAALSQAPERASRLLRHRYPTVAVTGMTGVGKTRLADRLSRRASAQSSAEEAGQEVGSAVMERRTRRTARLRGYRFRVVPGENAATRLGALDEVFHDEPVDGVLHVVANGHATPRRTGGTTGTARRLARRTSWPPSSRTGRSPRTASPAWRCAASDRRGSSSP